MRRYIPDLAIVLSVVSAGLFLLGFNFYAGYYFRLGIPLSQAFLPTPRYLVVGFDEARPLILMLALFLGIPALAAAARREPVVFPGLTGLLGIITLASLSFSWMIEWGFDVESMEIAGVQFPFGPSLPIMVLFGAGLAMLSWLRDHSVRKPRFFGSLRSFERPFQIFLVLVSITFVTEACVADGINAAEARIQHKLDYMEATLEFARPDGRASGPYLFILQTDGGYYLRREGIPFEERSVLFVSADEVVSATFTWKGALEATT